MAATVRSFATNSNSAGASTFVVTTGTAQVSDVLLAIHGNNFYTLATLAAPTGGPGGWSQITAANADNGTDSAHIKAWWTVVASAGTQAVTFNTTGAADEEKMGAVYVIQDADTTSPVDAAQGTGASADPFAATGLTATTSDALLIGHWTVAGSFASFTLSGGTMAELYEIHDGPISGVGGSEALTASGATGTRSANAGASSGYAATLIAIKAGSGGGLQRPPAPVLVRPGLAAIQGSVW